MIFVFCFHQIDTFPACKKLPLSVVLLVSYHNQSAILDFRLPEICFVVIVYNSRVHAIFSLLVSVVDMSRMTYALLLEECKGHKETGTNTYAEQAIQAGSLLEALKDMEVAETAAKFDPPLNYRVLTDKAVKVYCEPAVVHQLTTTENDILLGVKDAADRVQVYHNVKWVSLLWEGSHVLVQVPHINQPVQSAVHFIGYLPMESGIYFGVEFLVSIIM